MEESLREDVRVALANSLEKHDADAVEIACLRRAIAFSDARNFTSSWVNPRFVKLYINIARNVAVALKKRDDLREKVTGGAISADELTEIPPHSLFPDVWQKSVSEHGKRMQHAYETKKQAKTTAYRCSKCKQTNCDFTELQMRSADESMTLFVTCLTCGHAWRIG